MNGHVRVRPRATTSPRQSRWSAATRRLQYLAGGTTQLDLMLKDGVLNPERLVDITRLAAARHHPRGDALRRRRADDDGGARRRPGARRAGSRSCARRCSRAPRRSCATWRRSAATCCSARAVATSAIRRCAACNKRDARDRVCRDHRAGADARDPRRERALHRAARLRPLRGAGRARRRRARPGDGRRSGAIPLTEFYRLPGDRPDLENVLAHGELITAIESRCCPPAHARAI